VFQIGLNPYGLTYTLGLQGSNPAAIGLTGFIALVRELGLQVIELDHRWLTPLTNDELGRLRERLRGLTVITSFWLAHQPDETLDEAVRCTAAVGARILRFHLTPVLEGARAALGSRWDGLLAHARDTLVRESPRIAEAGLTLAIENHQDVGSEELLRLADDLGPDAGICLDTGNPYAVGEDPVAFVRRAAGRIRHVHLKDYIAQFTDDGYRLIRCPIAGGCVPFEEIATLLQPSGAPLTASIEPGALEARHIRLFHTAWWNGYPRRDASELATMFGRLRQRRLADDADWRTPWEMGAPPEQMIRYERGQIERSVENLRAMGWISETGSPAPPFTG
jgi:3-oxoisoapionate decarboxylase